MKRIYPALIVCGVVLGSMAFAQDIDSRFYTVGPVPKELSKPAPAVKQITINGALLRSQVVAGTITVRSWDVKEQKTSIDPDTVRTQENLEAYAQAVVLSDDDIEQLDLAEQSIDLTYRGSGNLLAFVPVRFTARAEVTIPKVGVPDAAAGQIKITFPWYQFLIKKSLSESDMTAEFAAQASILNSQYQVQRLAQYLSVIRTIVKKT